MTAPSPSRRKLELSLQYVRFMTLLNAALTAYLVYRLVVTGGGRNLGAVALTLAVAGITTAGAVYAIRLKKRL